MNPNAVFEKAVKDTANSLKEFEEKVKSPWVYMGSSVAVCAGITGVMWPFDVVKNHFVAGLSSKAAFGNKYSFRGIGFGLTGASIAAMDISQLYIKEFGEKFSPSKKAMLTVAPFVSIPILSMAEMLKINCQIKQQTSRTCFRQITKTHGMKSLLRGLLPFTSLHMLCFGMVIAPAVYSQKAEEKTVNPLLLLGCTFSYLLLSTPLDIVKTRVMLGESVTFSPKAPFKSLKISGRQFCYALLPRTFYMIVFAAVTGKLANILVEVGHVYKINKYQERKKAKYFAKDDEFDSFIPLSTDDLEQNDDLLRKIYFRDG